MKKNHSVSANPQVKNKRIVASRSKLFYKNNKISISNYGFFNQRKVFENFIIALTYINVDIVYIIKLRRFRFLDIINIILTKITNITILFTNIRTFICKCIK